MFFRIRAARIVAALVIACSAATSAAALEVTDILGRKIALAAPAQRVILGEGRFLVALAILDRKDPTARVAGMLNEFKTFDPAGYAQYEAALPALKDMPVFGQTSEASSSVEKAIALRPEVAIFGIEGHGPGSRSREFIDVLEAAGIQSVFIDFRREPMKNTTKSIKILGKLLGREAEATEFVDYYNAQMARVTDRLAKKTTTPDVFIEVRVGLGDDCCFTMANGMMGRFIEFAGGRNIAVGIVPGVAGTMNPEYLLASQPDVYIGTAIGAAHTMEQTPERIALGAGVDAGLARVSLKHSMQRPAMQALLAVRDGRAHAIWHHFCNSPLNVYAVQVFAKWLHPDLFDDLDPEQTMRTLYHRFQPVEMDGVYAISLTAP